MEAKLLKTEKIKNGGWLVTVNLTRFSWRKLRFITTEEQYFSVSDEINYATSWFNIDNGEFVDQKTCTALRETTYEFFVNLEQEVCRKSRLHSFMMNTLLEDGKRVVVK